jgi:hypothetical protein
LIASITAKSEIFAAKVRKLRKLRRGLGRLEDVRVSMYLELDEKFCHVVEQLAFI